MVELFAAFRFAEGPRLRSKSRLPLSPGRRLPTRAELNGPDGPDPYGRDLHPLRRITTWPESGQVSPCRPCPQGCQSGPQAIPGEESTWRVQRTLARVPSPSDRNIGITLRLPLAVLPYEGTTGAGGRRITPTSLRRAGRARLHAPSSTGSTRRVVSPAPLAKLVRLRLPGGAPVSITPVKLRFTDDHDGFPSH